MHSFPRHHHQPALQAVTRLSLLSTHPASGHAYRIFANWLHLGRVESAFSRICADGGANRVFNFFRQGSAEDVPKPSVILGDLDSITPAVHDHYKSIGVECLDMRKDQDSTDLDKCLAYVKDEQEKQRRKDGAATNQEDLVVVVGALGGRLDHTLGNLNSLYTHPNQNIVLVGEGNVVRLLQAGTTHVHVSKELGGLHCGVIPLREAVHVTSKGLKWDMVDLKLEFGGMISACNHVDKEDIEITCSGPCLWITTTKEHG